MSLYLNAFEICPYGDICPHSNIHNKRYICYGLIENRSNSFKCNLINIQTDKENFKNTETINWKTITKI